MPMGWVGQLRRRRGDGGAALVEFALVAPFLFMVLTGMFTGGIAFNNRLAVTNGVREGSRYGATLSMTAAAASPSCTSTAPMECWLQQVATITQEASEGQLASTVASRNICVAYVHPAGTTATDSTRRLVRTSSGDTFSAGTCFTDGRPSNERRVQVRGSRTGRLEWVLGAMDLTLASQSVTRFEASTP